MALKKNILKAAKDNLETQVSVRPYISYADYYYRKPLFSAFTLKNTGSETLEDLSVTFKDDCGLLVGGERHIEEIPFESSVSVPTEKLLSPLFLAKCGEETNVTVTFTVSVDGNVIAEENVPVKVLPFNCCEGLNGNPEGLAGFVRPRLADCQRILTDAVTQMRKWDGNATEIKGYSGISKNTVRLFSAAVYVAVKKYHIERLSVDTEKPFVAGENTAILSEEKATPVDLAVFYASCMEEAGLYPVIALENDSALCGVWLHECCSVDETTDDTDMLLRHVSSGVSNMSLFDVEDIYDGKNVSYTVSEKHAEKKIADGVKLTLDIKRCRIAGILPLPIRAKGQEELSDKAYFDTAPETLPDMKDLSVSGLPKNKNWERRLLDLSMKNALLHFTPRHAVHIFMPDCQHFLEKFPEMNEVEIAVYPESSEQYERLTAAPAFSPLGAFFEYGEVSRLELANCILRAIGSRNAVDDGLRTLIRKCRAADEEIGAKVLYLAIGFLRWIDTESGEASDAPLVLLPVTLVKLGGNRGYALKPTDDGYAFNTTLLEFLKAEFNIDIRGLDNLSSSMPLRDIFAAVRAGIGEMKDWTLSGDIYLATFSFARYAMWNDIRQNIDAYKENPLIESLLSGRSALPQPPETRDEDDYAPHEILTPLPADMSQFMALSEAATGASFVLHGPPGTGKSQTITNIIANALYSGKRVLFVAEKQAALQVVMKRLYAIGLGDFCLELHSGKTDKEEVVKKIAATLALRENFDDTENTDAGKDDALISLRESLRAPMAALHKKRRLGVSVYDAILLSLKYKNAPELFDIKSSFYDGLTKDKVEQYISLLTTAAAAARECGGIHDSPFTNVNITECTETVKNRIVTASKVLIAEQKNLHNYLTLFLETLSQKISILTPQKLADLKRVAEGLSDGSLSSFFSGGEEEYLRFYSAAARYTRYAAEYDARYKSPVDVSKEYAFVEDEIDNWGNNYRSSAVLMSILKKLRRVAVDNISEGEELREIERAASMERESNTMRSCPYYAKQVFDRFGGLNRKKLREYCEPLFAFHKLSSTVFMEYNADSLNLAAVRMADGHADDICKGFCRAVENFNTAVQTWNNSVSAGTRKDVNENVLQFYRTKAAAILDNIDLLPALCRYRTAAEELSHRGLSFFTELLESGGLNADNLVESFEKNVYRNFLETTIPSDPVLSQFSAGVLEDTIEKFRIMAENYDRAAGDLCRHRLISALPTMNTEGPLSLELLAFQRLSKQMRGVTLRDFFDKIPELLKVTSPCLLMSPITVSQYLAPEPSSFDLAVFDEASQMPTCEAVPSLARAKSAIVVGDQNQLPPTSFFSSGYVDEENLQNEDMESVLEEWLSLGLPERHLTWHYRSKHESLIAFSNAQYYENRLSTFPSPDAMESKVHLCFIEDGVYDRGTTKCNKAEADRLIGDVIERLKNPALSGSSIGIVTFSTAQQEYIERHLSRKISEENLESAAYEREEPLFIKNLENVQGDERDVILFSVCYGPDEHGKLSLNFGPLNQYGGWRRLNVAVSRAREEMTVYSSMTSAMIDLSRTGSKGVAGLKAFLEFAEKGRNTIAVRSVDVKHKSGDIGRYIAAELRLCGYECRTAVGVSDFKIDVAVVDPRNRKEFVLAILCDNNPSYPVRDRDVLQLQTLRRANWNVIRVFALNFYNNPKREARRIKDILDKIVCPDGKVKSDALVRARKPYKAAKAEVPENNTASYITSSEHDGEIVTILRNIVAMEEPISRDFLMKRCLALCGVPKSGVKVEAALDRMIALGGFKAEEMCGTLYYFRSEKSLTFDRFRVENDGETVRKTESDYTHYEIIAIVKAVLENKVSAYIDEINEAVAKEFRMGRPSEKLAKTVEEAISYGERNGLFIRSISDRISLQ